MYISCPKCEEYVGFLSLWKLADGSLKEWGLHPWGLYIKTRCPHCKRRFLPMRQVCSLPIFPGIFSTN
jgi:hypothetical protein